MSLVKILFRTFCRHLLLNHDSADRNIDGDLRVAVFDCAKGPKVGRVAILGERITLLMQGS